jgi:eight-cysteine-cluster-containing protein
MISKDLIKYIKECRKKGFSDLDIRNALIERGWNEKDVLGGLLSSMGPKKLPKWVSIVALVVVSFVIGGIVYAAIFAINDIQKTSAEVAAMTQQIKEMGPQAKIRTYKDTNLGFEVKYPTEFFQLDAANAALKHTLKNFHKYSLADGSDLGLADDIKIVFHKDITECDNSETTIKDIGTSFQIGGLRGIKYEMGAEGEGVVFYCVKNSQNKNIFFIERFFLSEAWSTELPGQADYLSSVRQEELFNQIISTFKFVSSTGTKSKEGFCGTSTQGSCNADTECMSGGCSGQVCQSKNEEPVITTCEYRDCYSVSIHGVICKCVNKKCQWQ